MTQTGGLARCHGHNLLEQRRGHRIADLVPQPREGTRRRQRRGAPQFGPGVAPGSVLLSARPFVAYAKPPDEGHFTVDAHQLAVVALEDPERIAQAGRVEGAHLDALFPEGLPVATRRGPAPHPVVQNPYLQALFGLCHEDVAERAAGLVVAQHIVLEVNEPAGALDGVDPPREGVRTVEVQPNVVVVDARRPGGAVHGLRQNIVGA